MLEMQGYCLQALQRYISRRPASCSGVHRPVAYALKASREKGSNPDRVGQCTVEKLSSRAVICGALEAEAAVWCGCNIAVQA